MSDPLGEYRAARERIDGAARDIAERCAEDLACKVGCDSCCVDGLTVLSVEAEAILEHLEERGLSATPAPRPGGCVFLDDKGACTIYEARPVVCRTHGLPLRMAGGLDEEDRPERPLRVLQDVEVCALNFTEREPAPDDVLDAERIAALLLVVEQRFRARAELPGPVARVSLRDVLSGVKAGVD